VAYTIGFLTGKSAIRIHRQHESDRRVWGKHFWAAGYCVSTVGLDEQQIRRYIQEQEKLESGQNALEFEYLLTRSTRASPVAPCGGYIFRAAPLGGLS
jgi:putative transposase